jgi:hypothetical protein
VLLLSTCVVGCGGSIKSATVSKQQPPPEEVWTPDMQNQYNQYTALLIKTGSGNWDYTDYKVTFPKKCQMEYHWAMSHEQRTATLDLAALDPHVSPSTSYALSGPLGITGYSMHTPREQATIPVLIRYRKVLYGSQQGYWTDHQARVNFIRFDIKPDRRDRHFEVQQAISGIIRLCT